MRQSAPCCQMQRCMWFEEAGEVQGFIGMDAEYIAGLFVAEGHRGHGIGHQLISEVKRKKAPVTACI